MTTSGYPTPVVLLRGGDEVVQREAVRGVVDDLVGDGDRSLLVEEIEIGSSGDESGDPLVALIDAAQTPPFLTDYRVVLGRLVDKRERAELVQPLVDYLVDPLPSTRLVIDWRAGRVPKSLSEAITRAGGSQVDTSPGRKTEAWVSERLSEAGLKVDSPGRARLVDWVGEEPSRLLGLLDLLCSTFGAGTRLGRDDLEPVLGDDGGVPPWDLTDAIDRGDRRRALELLGRMVGQGGRHPFQVLATLHTHYARMLRLDGTEVTSEKAAAELLGMKGSTFPAKKALGLTRRLGHERIVRAIELLAQADLDLRGGKAWPAPLVLEVLVARLATLAK
jgi:DNA polymerase-3 subunit delta